MATTQAIKVLLSFTNQLDGGEEMDTEKGDEEDGDDKHNKNNNQRKDEVQNAAIVLISLSNPLMTCLQTFAHYWRESPRQLLAAGLLCLDHCCSRPI